MYKILIISILLTGCTSFPLKTSESGYWTTSQVKGVTQMCAGKALQRASVDAWMKELWGAGIIVGIIVENAILAGGGFLFYFFTDIDEKVSVHQAGTYLRQAGKLERDGKGVGGCD